MGFCNEIAGQQDDVLVMGTGPSGLALASELARRGASVSCVAPDPKGWWSPNYGVWLDDLEATPEPGLMEATWSRPYVELDGGRRIELERRYGLFDNAALQARLADPFETHGGRFITGRVQAVEHDAHGSRVTLANGTQLVARVVVDATGSGSPFIARSASTVAHQSAYGERVRVRRHRFEPGQMALMDFSGSDDDPTFLYAMPLADDVVFVEETSLVRRPPMSHGALRAKLRRRLTRMGIEVEEVLDREACLIPMGAGLPHPEQRAIAFGGASSFVHPATGYQVARALRLAAPTAEAMLRGLERGPREAAENAYRTMWPSSARRAWGMYAFGMEVLAGLDIDATRRFMSAFFELPTTAWGGYMSGTLSPAAIAAAMARVFATSEPKMRWSLLGASTGPASRPLWRAMLPGGAR